MPSPFGKIETHLAFKTKLMCPKEREGEREKEREEGKEGRREGEREGG